VRRASFGLGSLRQLMETILSPQQELAHSTVDSPVTQGGIERVLSNGGRCSR
jgi:hypothetical protein